MVVNNIYICYTRGAFVLSNLTDNKLLCFTHFIKFGYHHVVTSCRLSQLQKSLKNCTKVECTEVLRRQQILNLFYVLWVRLRVKFLVHLSSRLRIDKSSTYFRGETNLSFVCSRILLNSVNRRWYGCKKRILACLKTFRNNNLNKASRLDQFSCLSYIDFYKLFI